MMMILKGEWEDSSQISTWFGNSYTKSSQIPGFAIYAPLIPTLSSFLYYDELPFFSKCLVFLNVCDHNVFSFLSFYGHP